MMASKGRKKPSLHDLTSQIPVNEDAVMEELLEGSDRACALIAASVLDYALQSLLSTQMLKAGAAETKPIFYGQTAILGSFSSKIRLCYALSLISKVDAAHLNTMRGIRNHFAHSLNPVSFSDPAVAHECSKLWNDTDPIAAKVSALPRPRAQFIMRWVAFAREIPQAYIDLMKRTGLFSDSINEALGEFVRSRKT